MLRTFRLDRRSVYSRRVHWYVFFFEQPLNQALQPVYRLLYRTAWLLAGGILLAVLAGVLLRANWSHPIRALQAGARQLRRVISATASTSTPATKSRNWPDQFNRMAAELHGSYSRLEQKVAERTSDLAQSIKEN
jgi:adenylate cyclase